MKGEAHEDRDPGQGWRKRPRHSFRLRLASVPPGFWLNPGGLFTYPRRAMLPLDAEDHEILQWLKKCDQVTTEDPVRGIAMSKRAVLASKRLFVRCIRVKAINLLSTGHCLAGETEKAEYLLSLSRRLAPNCNCVNCNADAKRRFAILRLTQERYAEAIDLAEESLQAYPTHKRRGRLLALHVKGCALDDSGRHELALAVFEKLIEEVSPEEDIFGTFHGSLAAALSHCPGRFREAAERLPELAKGFKGIRGLGMTRAKNDWLIGGCFALLAQAETDHWDRPKLESRAAKALKEALRRFQQLKLRSEAAAVAADLAAVEARRGQWNAAAASLLLDLIFPAGPLRNAMSSAATICQGVTEGASNLDDAWSALRQVRKLSDGCLAALVPYEALR